MTLHSFVTGFLYRTIQTFTFYLYHWMRSSRPSHIS